jgi:hypothetical protein
MRRRVTETHATVFNINDWRWARLEVRGEVRCGGTPRDGSSGVRAAA